MEAAVLFEPNTPLKIENIKLGEPGPSEVMVAAIFPTTNANLGLKGSTL